MPHSSSIALGLLFGEEYGPLICFIGTFEYEKYVRTQKSINPPHATIFIYIENGN